MAGAGTTTQVGGLNSGGGGSGTYLEIINNLSDLGSAVTARTNLGFSTLTDYVTLTGSQTLTNKTLTAPTATSPTITGTTSITGTTTINSTGVSSFTVGNNAGSVPINFLSRQSPTSTVYTASTNAVIEDFALYTKSTSGTPAAGYGGKLNFYADSNGNTNRNLGYLGLAWTTATDASRTSYAEFRLINSASLIQAMDVVPGGFNIYGTTSGVVSVRATAAAGTWTLTLPTNDGNANEFLQTNGSGVTTWAAVTDALLSTSDITTNDVSTTKHGFAPKAPNDSTKFLNGLGAWSVPAGGGGGLTAKVVYGAVSATAVGQNRSQKLSCLSTTEYVALIDNTNVVRYNGSAWTLTAHGLGSVPWSVASNGDVIIVFGASTIHRRSTDGGATYSTITHGCTASNYGFPARGGNNGASTTWVLGTTSAANVGMRSADNGATWSNVTINGGATSLVGLVSDGNTGGSTQWQATLNATTVRYSNDDGVTWANGVALAAAPTGGHIYAAGKFWACIPGSGQLGYTSTSNGSWTYTWLPGAVAVNNSNGFAYVNSKFVYIDDYFNVWTCADPSAAGAEWTLESTTTLSVGDTQTSIEYFSSAYYVRSASSSSVVTINKLS